MIIVSGNENASLRPSQLEAICELAESENIVVPSGRTGSGKTAAALSACLLASRRGFQQGHSRCSVLVCPTLALLLSARSPASKEGGGRLSQLLFSFGAGAGLGERTSRVVYWKEREVLSLPLRTSLCEAPTPQNHSGLVGWDLSSLMRFTTCRGLHRIEESTHSSRL